MRARPATDNTPSTADSTARRSGSPAASPFIPNSFQTPNEYVDHFMHLLTSDEWKVLSYTVRRIFGFQQRYDRISLTQYQTGTVSRETGEQLDHGTGLSRKTVVKVLASLCSFGLLARVAENDLQFNEGACYALQLDASKVGVAGLEERARATREANGRRVEKARACSPRRKADDVEEVNLSDSGSVSDTLPLADVSDTSPPVCETHGARCVGHTDNKQGKYRGNTAPPLARATSLPSAADANGGEGSTQPLTLDDFIACVEAESKTPKGATIRSVEHVARARWNRGRPEPKDVAEVRAFLANRQPGAVEPAASAVSASSPGLSFEVAATNVATMARVGTPPASAVEELFTSGKISDDTRRRLLEVDFSAAMPARAASASPAEAAAPRQFPRAVSS